MNFNIVKNPESKPELFLTINFYPHVEIASGKYIVELEIINPFTSETCWKAYTSSTKEKAFAIAKTQATKLAKKVANKIYMGG